VAELYHESVAANLLIRVTDDNSPLVPLLCNARLHPRCYLRISCVAHLVPSLLARFHSSYSQNFRNV